MKPYLRLLMARESKEVLGKGYSNLWLLTLVLVATFASIAFSEGSMIYLRDRMEDPFTNWVSIEKATDMESFARYKDSLELPENKQRFGYVKVQMDQTTNWNIQGVDENHLQYLSARCFTNMRSNLVKAILDKSNIIGAAAIDSSLLINNTLGFIISENTAKCLGYDLEKNPECWPTYIHLSVFTEGGDTLGIRVSVEEVEANGRYEKRKNVYNAVPLPVLAVVRRLPNNVDVVTSNFFYDQRENNYTNLPFGFVKNEQYLHQLRYYVSDEVGKEHFVQVVTKFVPDSLKENFDVLDDHETQNMTPWRPGKMYQVYIGDERMHRSVFQCIADSIEGRFNPELVRRVHAYNVSDNPSGTGDFISIEFSDLSHIRDFEAYSKNFGVQLDMAQVVSKENFQAVTVIARILSAAIVIFAIVCIIMFLVNMLQGYFQKVQRNIGTFKAFGMNTRELIMVYVLILVMIVCTAVVMALAVTWLIQLVLPFLGVEKNGFNYLSLWNGTTFVAACIILSSTVFTVILVMSRMLSRTPGDLIYDRN